MLIGYKLNDTGDEYSFIESIELEDEGGDLRVGRIEELIRFIDSKYVDSLDQEELIAGAINSIMNNLDPHSVYLNPEEASYVRDQVAGVFKGIGIESKKLGDTIYIQHVLDDSPAEKAGLQKFDIVKSINGIAFTDFDETYDSVSMTIRTKDKQQIEISRGGTPMSFTFDKGVIPVNSCQYHFALQDSIGYIEITRFSENTYQEFMDALEYLVKEKEIKHLIIDLRNNGGGLLPQVAKILNQLINEEKQLLVFTEGVHQKREEYRTTGKVFFPIDKIAILINGQSASGAEIMAATLQDLDRAVIIGQRSFGKGLVQEQYDLKNGAALRLTVAKYFTPTGRSIQKPFDEDYGMSFSDTGLSTKEMNKKVAEKDSLHFRTLYKNRIVYAHQGVSPDIEVVKLPSKDSKADDKLDPLAKELLYRAIAHQVELSDSSKMAEVFDESLLKKYKEGELKRLSSTLAKVAYSPVQYRKYKLKKDSIISVALSQLEKEDVLDY